MLEVLDNCNYCSIVVVIGNDFSFACFFFSVGRVFGLAILMLYLKKNEKFTPAVRSTKNDFLVKTQLCKLRMILRSRVLRGVSPREGYRSVTPLLMPRSTGLRLSALSCARKLYNPHEGD